MNPFSLSVKELEQKARAIRRRIIVLNAESPAGGHTGLFDSQPLWQVAMVLQATQAQKLGLRPDYGIDYQLLMAARESNIAVMELEGADSQIALLRDLPDGGMALLEDTLTHWRTNARLLQVMIGWWLEQPPSRGAVSLPTTFSQSLYDVLMHQRNLAWRETLLALPPGRLFHAGSGDGDLLFLIEDKKLAVGAAAENTVACGELALHLLA